MIKAVIFDADGVLIQPSRFSDQLSEKYHIPSSKIQQFFDGPFKDCILGKQDLKVAAESLLKDWNWPGTIEDFLNAWFTSAKLSDEPLMDYIQELRHHGTKCFVGTNNEKYRLNYLLNELGFAKSFDKVYGSGQIGFKKPDHQFFEYIMKDQKLKKNDVVFWDDDLENVDSANDYGIRGFLYTNFLNFSQTMDKLLSPSRT